MKLNYTDLTQDMIKHWIEQDGKLPSTAQPSNRDIVYVMEDGSYLMPDLAIKTPELIKGARVV